MRVSEPYGVFAIPIRHMASCDLGLEAKQKQLPPLNDSEWQWLGDVLRSGNGTLPRLPPLPCNETSRLRLPQSKLDQLVGSSSIAFTMLLRDAQAFVERNLRAIMNIGEAFARYWIFYTENDSRDDTKRILANFTRMHPDIFRGEMRDGVSATSSVQVCESELRGRNCAKRIELLSTLRQRVFRMAMQQGGWNAIVMLDVDFLYVNRDEFLQAFAVGMRIDAAAVFGQSVYRNSHGHCVLYDTGAYVMENYIAHSWKQERLRASHMKIMQKGCFGLVQSGHSGFPILYDKALRAASPTPRYDGHEFSSLKWGVGVVDLVPFNLMLSATSMNASLPPAARRPLVALGPAYNWGEGGKETQDLRRSLWERLTKSRS